MRHFDESDAHDQFLNHEWSDDKGKLKRAVPISNLAAGAGAGNNSYLNSEEGNDYLAVRAAIKRKRKDKEKKNLE